MSSKYKRLALTVDGKITMCVSPPDKIGQGRCNHTDHQEEGETPEEFIQRTSTKEEIVPYRLTEKEKKDLMPIKGRIDLANEDCNGGYIELDTPVWSPSNIQEFSEISGIKPGIIRGLIKKSTYLNIESLELTKNIKDPNSITGVDALNRLAEKEGYEATKDIYVLPYYMRQDTEEAKHPINVHYNYIIVSKNKGADKVQMGYDRLLDNKNVKIHNYKPLTSHGGFAVSSLAELVNGKKGVLRGYLNGFSIPYSGRAVISPNIDIEYGEVGLPSRTAAKIFSPTIKEELQKRNIESKVIDDWLFKFEKSTATEKDIEMLDSMMKESDMKVLINRQPSLHMGSLVCFKARVTEIVSGDLIKGGDNSNKVSMFNDTVQLSPLLAKGFNADFD